MVLNGVLQFLGCAGLAFAFYQILAPVLSLGRFELLYLAVATSLSSTLIVVKILSDRMELDSFTSRITLGVLVIQDLWAIAFLAMQPNLNDVQPSILAMSLGKAVLLVAVGMSAARYILPWVFEKVGKTPELLMIVALGWCFAMCGLANYLGLSKEMGALIAGVAIASYPYHVQVAVKISGLRDFFITLFFVGLGLQIPMPTPSILAIAGAVLVFSYVSRLLTIFPVLAALRQGNRVSLVSSLNLAQISEFSLVLASLGVQMGHVPQTLLSGLIVAFVFTALFSSLVIPNTHSIFRSVNPWLEKLGLKESGHKHSEAHANAHGHAYDITFLGLYREASSLMVEIAARFGQEYLKNVHVVDYNPESLKRLKFQGIPCHYGDIGHLDTLQHIGLENSQMIVSTIPDHILRGITNLKLLRELKKMAPNAKIVVTAETMESAREMYAAGADYVFMPRIISSRHLAGVLEAMEKGQVQALREEGIKELQDRKELVA